MYIIAVILIIFTILFCGVLELTVILKFRNNKKRRKLEVAANRLVVMVEGKVLREISKDNIAKIEMSNHSNLLWTRIGKSREKWVVVRLQSGEELHFYYYMDSQELGALKQSLEKFGYQNKTEDKGWQNLIQI